MRTQMAGPLPPRWVAQQIAGRLFTALILGRKRRRPSGPGGCSCRTRSGRTGSLLAQPRSKRDRAIVLLMLQGRLRSGEVLGMHLEDIAYGRRQVVVRHCDDHPKGARSKSRARSAGAPTARSAPGGIGPAVRRVAAPGMYPPGRSRQPARRSACPRRRRWPCGTHGTGICARWYSIVRPDQEYLANRSGSTFTWPARHVTVALGTSSRRGNRPSNSKNFSNSANPSRVAPLLFPRSSISASFNVQRSMRSSSSRSRRIGSGSFSRSRGTPKAHRFAIMRLRTGMIQRDRYVPILTHHALDREDPREASISQSLDGLEATWVHGHARASGLR